MSNVPGEPNPHDHSTRAKFIPDPDARFITVEKVVRQFSISRATLYRAIKSGELVSHKVRRKRLLRPDDVERWIVGPRK